MSQGILTFSDIMDMKTHDALVLTVKLIEHGNCDYEFTVNGELLITETSYWDINSNLLFECKKHGSGTLEIAHMDINGKQFMPRYMHLSNMKTHCLPYKCYWKLEIPSPFYSWFHEISGQGIIF